MSSMFEERERAFEAKWAHDEEMQFRVQMRRAELLGHWAAQELGLNEAEEERYVAALVATGLKTNDPAALFQKLRVDLSAAHSSAVILSQMDDCLQAASLDVGLERRPLGDRDQPAKPRGARMDFTRVLEQGERSAQREGETHFQMLRKITTRTAE
jgi:hypothetical protein